jgi:hypothetical protein
MLAAALQLRVKRYGIQVALNQQWRNDKGDSTVIQKFLMVRASVSTTCFAFAFAGVMGIAAYASPAAAQDGYPNKPIRIRWRQRCGGSVGRQVAG